MITKEKNRTKIICAVVTAISAIVAGGSAFQLYNVQNISQTVNGNVIQILGETGRVGTANKNALPRLVWEDNEIEVITSQWSKLREIPEVPGSYYVSRSIDQAFWATKNGKKSAKESIVHWSEECNNEITRKIKEYANKEQ